MNTRPRKRTSKLKQLLAFDSELLKKAEGELERPFLGVIGVDEVGRGSLVGPVVAAALMFPTLPDKTQANALADLDDSKAAHLNHPKRLALAESLKTFGYWGIGEASQQEIETLNIVQASLLASHRAIAHLASQFPMCSPEQHLLIVDGKMRIPNLPMVQLPTIKADAQSAAVAGASIIAKAYRDSMIMEFARAYPGYHWETNAGYPTPSHQQALHTLGVTPLHRKTYKIVQNAIVQQEVLL